MLWVLKRYVKIDGYNFTLKIFVYLNLWPFEIGNILTFNQPFVALIQTKNSPDNIISSNFRRLDYRLVSASQIQFIKVHSLQIGNQTLIFTEQYPKHFDL